MGSVLIGGKGWFLSKNGARRHLWDRKRQSEGGKGYCIGGEDK